MTASSTTATESASRPTPFGAASVLLVGAVVALATVLGLVPARRAGAVPVGATVAVADSSPLSVPEGNAGTHTVSFPVTLSATPATAVSVSFATMYGSASAGSDYVYQESTLTFAGGASGAALTQQIVVTINGDTTPESDENFFIQLYDVTGPATLGNRFGQAVIANDDSTAPVLSVTSGSPNPVIEGNAGTTPVTFTITLSATPTTPVTYKYATNYGTATAGVDYVYKEGTGSFAVTDTGPALSQTVTVLVNGDTTAEANETFFLQLYDVTNAGVPDPFGQAVIQNDDVAVPTISIGNDTSAESDGTIVLPVTLDISHTSPVTVKYASMPGNYFDTNATPGADFTAVSGTLTFPAGSSGPSMTQNITVPIAADGLTESSEHFYVQIYDPIGGNLAAQRYGKGSISAPPVANADSFTVVGNTKLAVGVTVTGEPARSVTGPTASVTANDTDPENDPLTVTAGATSTNGGTVVMNPNGSFTYLPPANFVGPSDTFTYTLDDGSGNTVTGTVTLNFAGRVWYVNNALAPAGDGRSTNPFNSLAPLTTGGSADGLDAVGDVIFVYQGGGNYGGGIVLEASQQLVGQPQGLVVGADTLLAASGSNPTITNASGAGITLANSNVIRRVNVASTSGAGITGTSITGADVGPNTSVTNTTGAGFALTGNASGTITVDASISQNSSSGRPVSIQNRTGGTVTMSGAITGNNTGILLDTNAATINLTGLVTMSTGANAALTISGPGTANVTIQPTSGTNSFASTTANTVDINNGGSGNVTIDGTISQSNGAPTTAKAVSVQNHTGGTVAFPKNVTSANGGGVFLNTNTGSTMNFTGGTMVLSTGANDAFTATGGGTVSVTGANNTLTSTTGRALNVASTTIGASNLVFKSISSNGAVNGILLNSTGSSGGLTVTGTGSAGTGGTIQNSTDSGVQTNGTTNLNLSWMTVQNNGNALNEGGLRLVNVFGTGQLTSTTVTGGFEDNVYLSNSSGTLTSFAIGGPSCSIRNNNAASGNTGISVLATLTSNMNVTINNCTFSGNRSDTIHTDTADSSTMSATITNNVITAGTGGANQGNIGIDVSSALTSSLTFDVSNNKIGTDGVTNAPLLNTGINLFAGNNSTITGKATNNTIRMAGAGFSGTGIRVFQSDSGIINTKVDGNTISNVGFDFGIDATDNGSGVGASTGKLNIAVTNNNASTLPAAINAIRVRGRRDTTTCARITGNTGTTAGGGNALSISQANTATYKFEIVPPPPLGALTDAQAQAELGSLNPGAVGAEAFSASGTGITGVAANSCSSIPS